MLRPRGSAELCRQSHTHVFIPEPPDLLRPPRDFGPGRGRCGELRTRSALLRGPRLLCLSCSSSSALGLKGIHAVAEYTFSRSDPRRRRTAASGPGPCCCCSWAVQAVQSGLLFACTRFPSRRRATSPPRRLSAILWCSDAKATTRLGLHLPQCGPVGCACRS